MGQEDNTVYNKSMIKWEWVINRGWVHRINLEV